VNDPAVAGIGHEDVEAMQVVQAPEIELLFHRVARRQEPDPADTGRVDAVGSRIRDVDQRDRDVRLDRAGDLVHGVRAQNEQLRPGGFQDLGLPTEQIRRLTPGVGALELLDVVEID
jgi:hypothetical protein